MLRTAVLNTAKAVARTSVRTPASIARPVFASNSLLRSQFTPAVASFQPIRCYSAHDGLSKDEIQGRILDLLSKFDKVQDATKLSPTSHFSNDLGLDSLDTVEVVMAIEEEFSIEIPDKEADAIHSVDHAVSYIASQPDAH
ncbi:acyl carrier protein-like protein [Aulographum hederae CBS 113979]|uniref:Acyl carrier protein n=1 Tax=Aulographum hederae CBS 113979 TaxID=1176131 RepID=A0A6G1GRT8_9PEZI|nr:acyl carrier protein-like protein [Aulographum hederae CBS 113979]